MTFRGAATTTTWRMLCTIDVVILASIGAHCMKGSLHFDVKQDGMF